MTYGVVDLDDFRSVGVQCQLCCKYQQPKFSDEEHGLILGQLSRSDTEIIDDKVEPRINSSVPSLRREGCTDVDHDEEMIGSMLENWWCGSFSIPAPCSYKYTEETRIRREEQRIERIARDEEARIHSEEQRTERNVHADEVDYEDLFKRLMNVNIYAIAEYMSNGEPFCFNEHLINTLILCSAIAALYLIS